MDDDKINSPGNQPSPPPAPPEPPVNRPIFETTPIEPAVPLVGNLQPEEVAPELETPEEVKSSPAAPFSIPSEEPPSAPLHDNKNKFFLIGGGIILFIIFFVLIIGFILGRNGARSIPVTLTYWGLWEDEANIKPLIQEYESKNKGITINYQKFAIQDYRDKLVARSAKGQGPDIFRFHNTWLPEIKSVVAALPPSIMSASEFDKTFYKIHTKDLKIGDSYFGIPLTVDGLVLVYNEGLFKKAGISSPPVTWDDLFNSAIKLTVKDANGKIVTSGIALGTATNIEHFSDILALFLIQNGVGIKDLDQPEAAQALEAYHKFAEPPDNVWDSSMPDSNTAFIQEKVAMIIVPSWEILMIKSANPELTLKAVPMPVIPGTGGEPKSLANYWVEGVSRTSKNQIEAWKFLKFLSQKETMTKLYENQSKSRLFGEPYSRVDLGPILKDNDYTGAVINQAQNFISIPMVSNTYDNGLNDEIVKYIEDAINATDQGVSYSQALSTAKDGITQVLKKFEIQ